MRIEQHELKITKEPQRIEVGMLYARAFAVGEVDGKLMLWYVRSESIDESIFYNHEGPGGRFVLDVQLLKTGDTLLFQEGKQCHIGTVVTRGGDVYHVYSTTEIIGGIIT
jgi:hypothetical protein